MSNGTASIDGVYAEFQSAVLRQLPRGVDVNVAKGWVNNQAALKKVLAEALLPTAQQTSSPDLSLDIWRGVYEALDMTPQFEDYLDMIDDQFSQRPGFWTVPVVKGVTNDSVVATLLKLGVSVTKSFTPQRYVTENDRDPGKGSYQVMFQASTEADLSMSSKSADYLRQHGICGITLLERLVLELAYFLATKEHLDILGQTMCAGSRALGGLVPSVSWDSLRGVCIELRYSVVHYPHLRTRAVFRG